MRIVIESGFFNPLHGGHLDMIQAGKLLGDKLIVIVKNDKQQLIKKGKIILDENNRVRLISSLRDVDEAVVAVDEDNTVRQTLEALVLKHPGNDFIFANGGYEHSEKETPEVAVCQKYAVQMLFGVGGAKKADSSTRINQAVGNESV